MFWCLIDIDHPWSKIVLMEIVSKFPVENGYELEVMEAIDERRITITGPEGTKLLSKEVVYQSMGSPP